MSQNTNNDSSVKVINVSTENDLLALFRTLHGKTLDGLKEVGKAPTFNQDFSKCTNEDYKEVHQAARALIGGARKARWEKEVAGIREGIKAVINTHMDTQRKEKAEYDAIPAQHRKFLAPFPTAFAVPLSACVDAFAKGTTTEQMVARCKELGYTVAKVGESFALKVAFVPAPTKSDNIPDSVKVAALNAAGVDGEAFLAHARSPETLAATEAVLKSA